MSKRQTRTKGRDGIALFQPNTIERVRRANQPAIWEQVQPGTFFFVGHSRAAFLPQGAQRPVAFPRDELVDAVPGLRDNPAPVYRIWLSDEQYESWLATGELPPV